MKEAYKAFQFLNILSMAMITSIIAPKSEANIKELVKSRGVSFDGTCLPPKTWKCEYPELQGNLTWKEWVKRAKEITLPMLWKRYIGKQFIECHYTKNLIDSTAVRAVAEFI